MTAKNTGKVGDSVRQLSQNEYLQRLIENADLRDNIRSAFESGRVIYGRMQNGKGPTRALLDDKKLHKELESAAKALRDASDMLMTPKKRRGGGLARLFLVLAVGFALSVALSESLRSKVLDKLFGAEEEFDYSSSSNASSPSPAPAAEAVSAS